MPESIGQRHQEPLILSHENVCQEDERTTQDTLYEVLEDISGKWQTIADEMGIDVSLLSHWTSNRGRPMPLYRLLQFTRVFGPALIRRILKPLGYDVIRIEPKQKATARTVA